MSRQQEMVRAFRRHLGYHAVPQPVAIRDGRLQARLVLEEAMELAVALVGRDEGFRVIGEMYRETQGKKACASNTPNIVDAVDAICDTQVTLLSTAEALGVDLDPHFEAVHEANMRKESRPIDEHGKRGYKPPGWVGPEDRIARVLEDQAFEHDCIHAETLEAIDAAKDPGAVARSLGARS